MLKNKINDIYQTLEYYYYKTNNSEFIKLDPLVFSKEHNNNNFKEIEVLAFISALFAFGNRNNIISFLNNLYSKISINDITTKKVNNQIFNKQVSGLKYRWVNDKMITWFLATINEIYLNFNSIQDFVLKKIKIQNGIDQYSFIESLDKTLVKEFRLIFDRISNFENLDKKLKKSINSFLTKPGGKSSTKRINLFLRWVIRDDYIDLGLWNSKLKTNIMYPLDIHILRITSCFLKTLIEIKVKKEISNKQFFDKIIINDNRYQIDNTILKNFDNFFDNYLDLLVKKIDNKKFLTNNFKDARIITDFYKCFSPNDPVRYDFGITFI